MENAPGDPVPSRGAGAGGGYWQCTRSSSPRTLPGVGGGPSRKWTAAAFGCGRERGTTWIQTVPDSHKPAEPEPKRGLGVAWFSRGFRPGLGGARPFTRPGVRLGCRWREPPPLAEQGASAPGKTNRLVTARSATRRHTSWIYSEPPSNAVPALVPGRRPKYCCRFAFNPVRKGLLLSRQSRNQRDSRTCVTVPLGLSPFVNGPWADLPTRVRAVRERPVRCLPCQPAAAHGPPTRVSRRRPKDCRRFVFNLVRKGLLPTPYSLHSLLPATSSSPSPPPPPRPPPRRARRS